MFILLNSVFAVSLIQHMHAVYLYDYELGTLFFKDITHYEKLLHHCFNFKWVFESVNLKL